MESQRLDMRDFLSQFVGTQMYDNFVTKRLYGSGESDVAFLMLKGSIVVVTSELRNIFRIHRFP